MNQQRAIIEALRCGTPSTASVAALGCRQPVAERRFAHMLSVAQQLPSGLIVKGGFGSGKSHTLEYLHKLALSKGYVCSRTTVNKETTLFDPHKLFRSVASSSAVPGTCGIGLREVIRRLRPRSDAYREIRRWVESLNSPVDFRFRAALEIFEHREPAGSDRKRKEELGEDREKLMQFCLGEPLGTIYAKEALKRIGGVVPARCHTETQRHLAIQQFQFISRLVTAAGFPGWVVLVDELELIGCYTRLQRAKSYVEIGRFMGFADQFSCPGLRVIFAITDDFAEAVLNQKGDTTDIPPMLDQRNSTSSSPVPTQLAVRGMKCISQEAISLQSVSRADLEELYRTVKQLYGAAYDWSPGDVKWPEQLQTTRMRHYVKSWITEWDMARLYPDEVFQLEHTSVSTDYSETPDSDEETTDPLMEELLGRILVD